MALIVLVTIVVGAATANNLNIVRMSPALPMLLVMMGIALDNIPQWVSRLWERISRGRAVGSPIRRRGPLVIKYSIVILYLVLALQVSRLNLEATRRMATDHAVLEEYANDDYAICHHIGGAARPGQRVYVYSPDGHWTCPREADQAWLYPGLHLELHPIASYDLDQNSHLPGDLVVVGTRSRGLRDDELAKLVTLADATGSRHSLQTVTNIAGRTSVASICIQGD